jgi:E3 ubiquitin-protein ligase TRIP12
LEEELDVQQPVSVERVTNVAVGEGKSIPATIIRFLLTKLHSDGAKVVAQTPEGTRVATPNPNMDTTPANNTSPTRASYAAAAKTKPNDWHLVFTMEDHVLPLDMTIYRAVHQQEARRGAATVNTANIWNGIYTIKFKKVAGPPPAAEGIISI